MPVLWSRNCGKIFCADCSENTVPLPNEQLYDPVRVCSTCYSLLHSTSSLLKPQQVNGSGSTNGFLVNVDPPKPLPLSVMKGSMDSCKQQGTDVKCPKPVVTAASTWTIVQNRLLCWHLAWKYKSEIFNFCSWSYNMLSSSSSELLFLMTVGHIKPEDFCLFVFE